MAVLVKAVRAEVVKRIADEESDEQPKTISPDEHPGRADQIRIGRICKSASSRLNSRGAVTKTDKEQDILPISPNRYSLLGSGELVLESGACLGPARH
jgi:hypothetical protein